MRQALIFLQISLALCWSLAPTLYAKSPGVILDLNASAVIDDPATSPETPRACQLPPSDGNCPQGKCKHLSSAWFEGAPDANFLKQTIQDRKKLDEALALWLTQDNSCQGSGCSRQVTCNRSWIEMHWRDLQAEACQQEGKCLGFSGSTTYTDKNGIFNPGNCATAEAECIDALMDQFKAQTLGDNDPCEDCSYRVFFDTFQVSCTMQGRDAVASCSFSGQACCGSYRDGGTMKGRANTSACYKCTSGSGGGKPNPGPSCAPQASEI